MTKKKNEDNSLIQYAIFLYVGITYRNTRTRIRISYVQVDFKIILTNRYCDKFFKALKRISCTGKHVKAKQKTPSYLLRCQQ